MKTKFYGSVGLHARAVATGIPRLFRQSVIMLLVISLLSAGQASSAQAAPAALEFRFFLNVIAPRTTLCTGETVTYRADVNAEAAPFNGSFVIKVAGVKVDAFPADKTIGAFIGADKSGGVSRRMGSDLSAPASVVFKFKAGNKPGTSKLYFDGAVPGFDIQNGYISFTVPVRVIACKYRVTTITKFPPNASYNPMLVSPPITVKMTRAEVTADQNGHFNGSGSLRWIGSTYITKSAVGIATAVEKFGSTSPASLNGEIFENGQLVLDLTYESASSSLTETVQGVSQGQPSIPYLLDPLRISVPASGGSIRLPQGYNSASFMGTTFAIVSLVKTK